MKRLRAGIILIILSWLPFAQLLLYIAHSQNRLSSEQASSTFRATIWTIQVLIGLVGLWLAGKVVIDNARKDGWRRTPKKLWLLFWNGPIDANSN